MVARPPPPWSVDRVGEDPSPIVVHVPHSSTFVPAEERRRLVLDDAGLALELDRMTDWYTDRLAADAVARSGVAAAVFVNGRSRLVVDPERLVDGTERMEARGMGAVYRVTSQLSPLRRPDPDDERRLLERWFHPYADALADVVDGALAACGHVLIVDLHSYPSVALPYEGAGGRRPGICVGTDSFHTPPALRALAMAAFAGAPGGVGENTPFAGTYTPARHGRDRRVASVMVEVRRDLYQAEPGGPPHAGYDVVVELLADFLRSCV